MTSPYQTTIEWATPPSETIFRLIYQKKINLNLFREKLGMNEEEFANLMHDKLQINKKLAFVLSDILGGSENFWINRYEDFDKQIGVLNNEIFNEYRDFLTSLSRIRVTPIDNLLLDFKVSSFEKLILDYFQKPKIMYSKSQKIEPSPVRLASWVRDCEIMAESKIFGNSIPIFDAQTLQNELGQILSISKINSIELVIQKLKSILSKCGIILILSPSKIGMGVSGLTKPLLKRYKLIVVTDRYQNNAAFWFTLLHELGHCLLHQISQTIIHYSDDEFILASDPTMNVFQEEEANKFVEELLFTSELINQLKANSKSYRDIIRLGVKYDISPSFLVAQIHRLKLAPYSHFRKVYRKVNFKEIH